MPLDDTMGCVRQIVVPMREHLLPFSPLSPASLPSMPRRSSTAVRRQACIARVTARSSGNQCSRLIYCRDAVPMRANAWMVSSPSRQMSFLCKRVCRTIQVDHNLLSVNTMISPPIQQLPTRNAFRRASSHNPVCTRTLVAKYRNQRKPKACLGYSPPFAPN